jgi:hypothetical protein
MQSLTFASLVDNFVSSDHNRQNLFPTNERGIAPGVVAFHKSPAQVDIRFAMAEMVSKPAMASPSVAIASPVCMFRFEAASYRFLVLDRTNVEL